MNKERFIKITAVLCLLGCVSVILADIIGIAVHDPHNPIRDTISQLAIGKYGWIQDWGINLFAIGYFALAVGLYLWKNSGTQWLIALFLIILLGIDFIIIAEHNQYAGDQEHTLHRKLVYVMAALYPAMILLSRKGLKELDPFFNKFCIWVAVLWILMAVPFPYIPDQYDGGYERIACILLVLWPAVVSLKLFRRVGESD